MVDTEDRAELSSELPLEIPDELEHSFDTFNEPPLASR